MGMNLHGESTTNMLPKYTCTAIFHIYLINSSIIFPFKTLLMCCSVLRNELPFPVLLLNIQHRPITVKRIPSPNRNPLKPHLHITIPPLFLRQPNLQSIHPLLLITIKQRRKSRRPQMIRMSPPKYKFPHPGKVKC